MQPAIDKILEIENEECEIIQKLKDLEIFLKLMMIFKSKITNINP